jgi:hypothetical protein
LTRTPARRPQSGSTEPPGDLLGPHLPEPSREAPKWLHRASWRPSGAPWGGSRPDDPKVAPQSLLGAFWGLLCQNPAGRPQSGSTEPPGSHLGLSEPDPSQMAPKWLHKASWEPSGASLARTTPGLSNASLLYSTRLQAKRKPHNDTPHTGHTISDHTHIHHTTACHTQATRRPHD